VTIAIRSLALSLGLLCACTATVARPGGPAAPSAPATGEPLTPPPTTGGGPPATAVDARAPADVVPTAPEARDARADAAAPPAVGPRASAGCGKPNPTNGARTIMTGGQKASYIVHLPASYDPGKPLPLGFAFHGYGLDEKTCAAGSECPGFKDLNAITVYMKSLGPGWEDNPTPLMPNLKFFEDTVALMKSEYCVDEGRIFVAGVSSGGQFVEHLACHYGDWLWAVSPIAAFVDKGVDTGCKGTPAQIVIHGITDHLADHAHPVRDLFAHRNGCPDPAPMVDKAEADMMAAFAARKAEIACVDYQACARAPVRYCLFSQITYNGLTHGWPDLGGKLIQDFLATLPAPVH